MLGTSILASVLYSTNRVYAPSDWLSGWSYRRKLTVNEAQVDADLTNFPVLVKLDSSFFDFDKAQNSGEDIRFTSSDGLTLLKYEIERWDQTGGKAEIWAKLPTVSGTSNTDFYIYYGNPSALDAQDPTNVWDPSFKMVQHIEESSGTGRTDSTSNDNDGTTYGVAHVSENIDGSDNFDGTNDYTNMGDRDNLDFGLGSFSYTLWFRSETKGTMTQHILSKKAGTLSENPAGYKMGISSTANTFSCNVGDGTVANLRINMVNSTLWGKNVWAMFTVVVDRSTSVHTMFAYINGGQQTASLDIGSMTGSTSTAENLTLGKTSSLTQYYFQGGLDEIRIASGAWSAAWIKASYNSEKNTLLTYGSEELPSGPPSFSNIATSTTQAGAPCKFHAKWTDTDGLHTCIFSNNNTGPWLNETLSVSGTESWANKTLTLSSTIGQVIGYRWYCNDTLGYMSDTGIRTLITTGWQYSKKLFFRNDAISESLVDFPVMVNLTRAGTDFWSRVGTSYTDLRFTDSDGLTDLYFEVEYWNYAEGKAYVWVRVPQIDAGSAADYIYVYYGNPSPPESPYLNSPQVWDGSFKMVQHLEETSGTVTDSTSYHNDGMYHGAMQDAQGKVDGADAFDGDFDYINCTHSDSLNLGTGDFTISVWVKYADTNNDADILRKGNTADTIPNNYKIELTSNRIAGNLYDGGDSRVETTEVYNDGEWHFVVFRREAGTIYLYIDGNLKASQTGAGRNVSNTSTFSIGSKNPPLLEDFFNGTIDEVWIANTARSGEWVKAQNQSMNDRYIRFEGELPPNNPPNKPTDPNPSNGATGTSTSVILTARVTDPDGETMSVSFYGTTAPVSAQNFTIVVLPDTQLYSESYPLVFSNQTQWIVNNAATMNILFVTHEGDIVNVVGTISQWNNANASLSKLDNNVPWGVLPGNHDYSGTDFTNYNNYFGYTRFSGETWYGGGYPTDTNINSYQLFSSGADDYLIFHFQNSPSAAVLAWANTTIDSYPTRRVIVTTHDYMSGSTRTTAGNAIWNGFIRHHADQVFLVLSGHSIGEAQRTDTVDGHNVYQLLANYQDRTNGGNGWLRTLSFHPAEDKVYVRTYSPYLKSYEIDSNSQFTLNYDMTYASSLPQLIGTVTNVSSGGVASLTWPARSYSSTYQWYVVAIDERGGATQSDIWAFATREEDDLRCDFNQDGMVEAEDLEILVRAYGSTPGVSSWNAICDFNNNDIIGLYDLHHFARSCYGKSRQGTGILNAYISDSEEVEKNGAGNYLVYPGGTYHFNITEITEYENANIGVWACYKIGSIAYNIKIGDFPVGSQPSIVEFDWTVPSDLPITTSIKFKYGIDYKGPVGTWFYARKDMSPSPRLLLVVPETFLGSLGAIAALFAGLKTRSYVRKKKYDLRAGRMKLRGRTKIISLVAVLSVIIITSLVFASGSINVSQLSLFNTPLELDADGEAVFIDPATTIKDYINDPGYQIGDELNIIVRIAGVADLYSYQINVTWAVGMLNYTGVTYGSVLYDRSSPYGSSSHNVDMNHTIVMASNVTGFASIAETVLGDPSVASSDGVLITIHFEITGYGYTWIDIGTAGILPTMFLDSTNATLSFTPTGGYFRNVVTGDANLDKKVNVFDILAVKSRWERTPASPDWIREYDVNDDAAINVFDILTVKANWGRTAP